MIGINSCGTDWSSSRMIPTTPICWLSVGIAPFPISLCKLLLLYFVWELMTTYVFHSTHWREVLQNIPQWSHTPRTIKFNTFHSWLQEGNTHSLSPHTMADGLVVFFCLISSVLLTGGEYYYSTLRFQRLGRGRFLTWIRTRGWTGNFSFLLVLVL